MRLLLKFVGLIGLAALIGCAQPSMPVPADPATLAPAGQAVLVSRGFARLEVVGSETLDVVQGVMAVRRASGAPLVNLLSQTGGWAHNTGLYNIQVVPAGTYQLGAVSLGNLSTNPSTLDPVSRIVMAPGEVVYVGDIDLRAVTEGRSSRAEARISDQSAQARAGLATQSPQLAAQMKTRLITCLICVRQ